MFQSNLYGGQRPKKRNNKPKRGGAVVATPAPFGYGYGGAIIPYGYSIAGGAIIGGARAARLPTDPGELRDTLRLPQYIEQHAQQIEKRRAKAALKKAAAAGYGYGYGRR